jgi:hypothetical protein
MKNLDSIFKFILWFGFGILGLGLFQKISNRGGGLYITIGMIIIFIQFIITAFLNKEKSKNNKETILKILFWIGSFFLLFGIIFKIQYWPGSTFLLFLGLTLLFVHYVFHYYYSSKNDVDS